MAKCDFLIVGAGLFGAAFAQRVREAGRTCMVVEKRPHVAGNCHSRSVEGVEVHSHGPHCFHANDGRVWAYANRFAKFTQYAHRVKAKTGGRVYSMPVNLQTLYEVYGAGTPAEARAAVAADRVAIERPANLEEYCLSQVGPKVYELFIRHYTAKQWGRDPRELPASIIKRLPVRYTFDDRWHEAAHSGVPAGGYTRWVEAILDGVPVELGVDFFKTDWRRYARRLVYTGRLDELFDYCYGRLEYRSLRFETEVVDGDYQGVAQVNYTGADAAFTRVTEHKHFSDPAAPRSPVTREYPLAWTPDATPYYPVNDDANESLKRKYKQLLASRPEVIGGGRLCEFKYLDMSACIAIALKKAEAALVASA